VRTPTIAAQRMQARAASSPGRRATGAGAGSPGRGRKRGRVLWPLLVLLLLVGAGAGIGLYYRWEFNAPGPSREAVRVQVAQGETLKNVLTELAAKGVLQDPRGTLLYMRVQGLNPRIKIGTYEFPAQASPAQIIEQLQEGRVVLEQMTIIEGSTFAEFRRALDDSPVVTHALRGKSDSQIMAALGHADEAPEGRFFPDTYRFAAQTSDLEILQLAYNKMAHLLEREWPGHDGALPYSTAYQALTLASLVEKETGLAAERPRIAGVFINRLRKGMRLQTDPAVAYGMGEHANAKTLHKRDLEVDTPYNTYTRGGLPPTPIALPSREAVLAALHPEPTDSLYFVATGNGGHKFSRTLEEHNAAVREWEVRLRENGSAQ
jgi:UPF0755 protein